MRNIILHIDGNIYVQVYSLWYKVIAMHSSIAETNTFLERHKDCSVLAMVGKMVVIANSKDTGVRELPSVEYDIYGVPV